MAPFKSSVYALPKHAPDAATFLGWSARLKALRLNSLRFDPNSWVSIFENEVKRDTDFWLKRLSNPRAIHLVLASDRHERENSDEPTYNLHKTPWAAFGVIIVPEHEAADNSLPSSSSEYAMATLHVDAKFRGCSLGKRLVQAVLEAAKSAASEAGAVAPFCTTTIRHRTDRALQLYQTLGFQIIDSGYHSQKERRLYTSSKLRIDL